MTDSTHDNGADDKQARTPEWREQMGNQIEDKPTVIYQGHRLGWQDVRNPEKWMTVKLDPYCEHAAVEVRINHGETFIATPKACREMAERLLTLARVVENLEPRDGELRRIDG